jgi:hypothetical protein
MKIKYFVCTCTILHAILRASGVLAIAIKYYCLHKCHMGRNSNKIDFETCVNTHSLNKCVRCSILGKFLSPERKVNITTYVLFKNIEYSETLGRRISQATKSLN